MQHLTLMSRKTRRPRRPRGFTLIELLVVILILAVLAMIVVPQFISATTESRQNSIKMDLNRMRTQLGVYREQHNNEWPTLANFRDQLTQASDADGNTAVPGTAGFKFGPYILDIPVNPLSGGSTVGTGGVGSSDWYYDEATGDFHANDSDTSRAY